MLIAREACRGLVDEVLLEHLHGLVHQGKIARLGLAELFRLGLSTRLGVSLFDHAEQKDFTEALGVVQFAH